MIRINLLAVERERRKTRAPMLGTVAQRLTATCSVILVVSLSFCGWRFWKISRQSSSLDKEIATAQEETVRLHSIIQQVQQFEQRKAQLQQRVVLIEQLRKTQTGPVHMLDQISRALTPMLWLTELKQVGGDVVIDGKCTTLTGISDFVANLESSGYFKRSVEIVSTQTETIAQAPGELIKFSVRAQFQPPGTIVAGGSGGPGASSKSGQASGPAKTGKAGG